MDAMTPRILIVEDDPANGMVAENFMEIFGYQSDIAQTGDQALDMLRENNAYHAILMDVQMPDISGLDITRKIRELERNSPTKSHIIGMTAHARPDDKQACLDAGMDDYITKPFDPEQLKQKLRSARMVPKVS